MTTHTHYRSDPGPTQRTPLTPAALKQQTLHYTGTGGTSVKAGCAGFAPAFLDQDTNIIYRACFGSGAPAPMHILDGLPEEVILVRDVCGRVIAAKQSLVAGFIKEGVFYTREQAACVTQDVLLDL